MSTVSNTVLKTDVVWPPVVYCPLVVLSVHLTSFLDGIKCFYDILTLSGSHFLEEKHINH